MLVTSKSELRDFSCLLCHLSTYCKDFVYEPESHQQIFNAPVNELLKLGLTSQSLNVINTVLLFMVILEQSKHINFVVNDSTIYT